MTGGGTTRSFFYVSAAVTLGMALQINDGLYNPIALGWVIVTGLLLVGAFAFSAKPVATRTVVTAALAAAIVLLAAGFFRVAGATHAYNGESQTPYQIGLGAAAVGLIAAWLRPRWANVAAIYLLVIFTCVGVWKIRACPTPDVDVFDFQTDSPNALVHGVDPYTITFPNRYGPETTVYGPGIVRQGRLLFGYPYPPLVLYWITPAQKLLGDFRYAQVLALALAGLLITRIAPGPIGVMAAALLLFSPRMFYVIEGGWTEPLSILLLAWLVWLNLRQSRWTLVAFGLFLASKQYLPIVLLLTPLLLRKGDRWTAALRLALDACAIALLVSLPLILWNFAGFVHSAVTLQLHQPFRDDALSVLALVARNELIPDSAALRALLASIAFGAAGIAGVGAALRRRTSFIAAATLQLMLFFVLNKQAFVNYYALVLGGIVLALAVDGCGISAEPRSAGR